MSAPRPTIFFDCDGVLNEELGPLGVLTPDQIKLISGAAEAVAAVNEAGWLAIAVTNRAQVARGRIDLQTLEAILARLRALLAAGSGRLDALYFCPHLPPPGPAGADPSFVFACDCRKPKAGMLRRAAAEWPIDRDRCVMIGDSHRDIGAARAFGIPVLGVLTGHACADADPPPAADRMFSDVGAAVAYGLTGCAFIKTQ